MDLKGVDDSIFGQKAGFLWGQSALGYPLTKILISFRSSTTFT